MSIPHRLATNLKFTKFWRRIHRHTVPVLLIHGVLPDADSSPFNASGKIISPTKLRTYLERIMKIFTVIPCEQLIDQSFNASPMSKKIDRLVITFDDGYANNLIYALPILQSLGAPFTIFVTAGFIDSRMLLWNDLLEFAIFTTSRSKIEKSALLDESIFTNGSEFSLAETFSSLSNTGIPIATVEDKLAAIAMLKNHLKNLNVEMAQKLTARICDCLEVDLAHPKLEDVRFMTRDQIRKLVNTGVVIGSHGLTHAILSREPIENARDEIFQSKSLLQELTGKNITLFAYPNGRREDFTEEHKQALKEAGYVAAFTTIHGLYLPGTDPFEIKRISWDNRWSYEEFESHVVGLPNIFKV